MENDLNKKKDYSVGKNWNNQKMKLLQNFSQLTSADLIFEPGKESEMLERLEVKLSLNRENLLTLLDRIRSESEMDGTTGIPF